MSAWKLYSEKKSTSVISVQIVLKTGLSLQSIN